MQESYDPAAVERAAQQYWDEQRAFAVREDSLAPEVLLPVDVPVPLRPAAHGARAQLHHRRRARALHAHAGLQRAAADGLGCLRAAGRERRHQQQRAAGEVDAREHRLHARADEVARLRDRLGARVRHLRSRLLPLEPVAVPAHAREGHRLPQDRGRQLGPGRPDRARQRAGHRRARLAHRRAGREARDPDVLPEHHALRPGAARTRSMGSGAGRSACASCRPTGSAAARAARSPSRSARYPHRAWAPTGR